MKKIVIFLLCAALCASLASCTAKNTADDTTVSAVQTEVNTGFETEKTDSKSDETTVPDESESEALTTSITVNWQTAAVSALSEYAEDSNAVYYLYDMNSDKVPELVVHTGKSSADLKYMLYDLSEKSPKATVFGVGTALLCGFGGNGVILQYAKMGEETVTQYTFKDGKLSEKVLFSRDVPLGEDYVAFTPLAQYSVGDFSGLSWNGNQKDSNADLIKNIK